MTIVLLSLRRIHVPTRHRGLRVRFADTTWAYVFRETVVDRPAALEPCVLVVKFRLRSVHGRGHAFFRRESLLNTVLFAGFPGLVSKLWLAHDQRGVYRGLYEWDGPASAEIYARALWRILMLVSLPDSIDYQVLPGIRRDDLFTAVRWEDPCASGAEWWRVTEVVPPVGRASGKERPSGDDRSHGRRRWSG
ncbi:hypothetical protein [Nocardia sp. NPDC051750]|uniref:hypothetical protein n=1 Tax=Nocardia sp. NPDC051750 TaxID=3364325 RepID=UPI0037A6FAC7